MSEWRRKREARLNALIKRPVIRIEGIRRGTAAVDLRPLGALSWHFDAEKDQFYVQLPAPFERVRLYETQKPTLTQWAEINAALKSFGVTFTEEN